MKNKLKLMPLRVLRKKIVILLVSAEITVLLFFCLRGEFVHAFLIASAIVKEALHIEVTA